MYPYRKSMIPMENRGSSRVRGSVDLPSIIDVQPTEWKRRTHML